MSEDFWAFLIPVACAALGFAAGWFAGASAALRTMDKALRKLGL